MSFTCPTCLNKYVDIHDHIRKKHPLESYTASELQPLSLTPCPTCGIPCKGEIGIKTHSQKIHGTIGSSRLAIQSRKSNYASSLATPTNQLQNRPRNPLPLRLPLTSSTFQPDILVPFLREQRKEAIGQKRQARTPSPGAQPSSSRQRVTSPTPIRRVLGNIEVEDVYTDLSSPAPTETSLPLHQDEYQPSTDYGSIASPTAIEESILATSPLARQPPSSLAPLDKNDPIYNHQQAISADLQRPSVQTLLAYSKIQVPEKQLHSRQANLFTEAAERCAEAFIRQPGERALLRLLLLPRVLGIGLQHNKLASTLRAYPTTLPPLPEEPERPDSQLPQHLPVKRAITLLERGYVGRAAKALTEPTSLAPNTLETLQALYQKHPIGHKNPFQGMNPRPGQVISLEDIQVAITSISKEKAPGLSGWTRPLLDIATSKPNSSVISALRLLTDMIRQGTAPGQALLCASRLIALQKEDGGIRPIAVGDMIYRVALKTILTSSFQTEMLLPNQLGVNSAGGVEPAVFLLEEAISGNNSSKIEYIASLDLSNAFNTISRRAIASSVATYAPTLYRATKWAYNNPSILVTHSGETLASAEGVRQGDPMAPLLFSLALRPTLEHLLKKLPNATIVAYLDDIYILNRDDTKLLPLVAKELEKWPVRLNQQKSTEESLPTLRKRGLKVLGTFVGPRILRRKFLQEKIDTLYTALAALRELPKQYTLLLLKGSIHLLLRHLLRQLRPEGLLDLWDKVDLAIKTTISTLVARAPSAIPQFNQDLITMPVKDGGLGIPSHRALAEQLFVAAGKATALLIQKINPLYSLIETEKPATAREVYKEANKVVTQRLKETLSQEEEKARLENTSYLNRQWIKLLPTQKRYQLTDLETTEALRSRLLIPCRPPELPCNYCGSFPAIGHEDVCRGANRRWIARHNQITRAFVKTLSCRDDLEVAEEPLVGAGELRADFSVLLGTSRYYYDVQIVAINKDSARQDAFDTLTEAANEKRRKYSALGAFFEPMIFSAGGLMEKDTAKAYKKLQKLLGPARAQWLDTQIALTLTQARAISAGSIAKV